MRARAGGHVVLRSVAKQGHVMLCFTRRRRARVTWYSVSQAKTGSHGPPFRGQNKVTWGRTS
ncbi:hypothetical protein chiPu_0024815, partial [Chiloscyllium punctatum]|nr:hypothetical protein [Chiloscyllium punctatum]